MLYYISCGIQNFKRGMILGHHCQQYRGYAIWSLTVNWDKTKDYIYLGVTFHNTKTDTNEIKEE